MTEEERSPMQYKGVRPPHIHMGFSKDELMLKTFLMLTIIAIGSSIIMGINALIHILTALGTVFVIHTLIISFQKLKKKTVSYNSYTSTLVAGMIVGLAMPIAGPFYITAAVASVTVLVFKFGQNWVFIRKYINPAAGAKTVLLGLVSVMLFFENSLSIGQLFHPHHLELNLWTAEGFEASMWIFQRVTIFGRDLSATASLLFWQTHGWIGGACGILVLIVGSVATIWLRYKWRIVVSALLTMIGLAVIFGLILRDDVLLRISFHVFTGSFIFMVFFMATEPQSTPLPELSQIIFGISLAVITFFLQLFNVLGGSIFALVLLNIATPFLDKIGFRKPYGLKTRQRRILK